MEWQHPTEGHTPLMFACMVGAHRVTRFLLQHGANPDPGCFGEGATALHMAVKCRALACVLELVGPDSDVPPGVALMFSMSADSEGSLPLHLAAAQLDVQTVRALLEVTSAALLTRNAGGRTPLQMACAHASEAKPVSPSARARVERTLATGKKASRRALAAASAASSRGAESSLLTASLNPAVQVVRLLLDPPQGRADGPYKPRVSARDTVHWGDADGLCALHLAAQAGADDVVRVLVAEAGANPTIAGSLFGETPLELARGGGHSVVASVLDDVVRNYAWPAGQRCVTDAEVAALLGGVQFKPEAVWEAEGDSEVDKDMPCKPTASGDSEADDDDEMPSKPMTRTAFVAELPLSTPGPFPQPITTATMQSAVAARQRARLGIDGKPPVARLQFGGLDAVPPPPPSTRKGLRATVRGKAPAVPSPDSGVSTLTSFLGLPKPWRALRHGASGHHFFHSQSAGESVWAPPAAVVDHLAAVASGLIVPPPAARDSVGSSLGVDDLPAPPSAPPPFEGCVPLSLEALAVPGAAPSTVAAAILGVLRCGAGDGAGAVGTASSGVAALSQSAPLSPLAAAVADAVVRSPRHASTTTGAAAVSGLLAAGGPVQPSDHFHIMAQLRNKLGQEVRSRGTAVLGRSQTLGKSQTLPPMSPKPAAPAAAVTIEAAAAPSTSVSSDVSAGSESAEAPAAVPLLAQERFAAYTRMVAYGQPAPAAVHRARMEGKLTPSEVAQLEAALEAHSASGQGSSALKKLLEKPSEAAVVAPAAESAPASATSAPAAAAPAPALAPVAGPDPAFANPEAAKYVGMMRVGIPPAAVLLKMRSEGVPADVVRRLEEAVAAHAASGAPMKELGKVAISAPAAPASASANAGAPDAAPTAASDAPSARTRVEGDERFKRFVAMRKRGVPLGAIKHAMMGADSGVGKDDARLFLSAYATPAALEQMGLLTPPKPSAPAAAAAGDGKLAGKGDGAPAAGAPGAAAPVDGAAPADAQPQSSPARAAPRSKRTHGATLKFHWDPLKLSSSQFDQSVWGWLRASSQAGAQLSDDDVALLVNLFGTSTGAAVAASSAAPAAKPAKEELKTLLDFKRANNLNISLAQFRKFASYAELFGCVYRLDAAALPRESIEKLLVVMPQPDELKLMRECTEDPARLMECDRFFLSVLGVPRFQAKVCAFQTLQAFEASAADVGGRASMLKRACEAVTSSKHFTFILSLVLEVGNKLNAGHDRLETDAISLDSLVKLSALRAASDKKTTAMDVVVLLVDAKRPEALGFGEELARGGTAAAHRIEVSDLRSDLSKLTNAVASAGREAAQEGKDVEKETPKPPAVAAPVAPAVAPATEVPAAAEGSGASVPAGSRAAAGNALAAMLARHAAPADEPAATSSAAAPKAAELGASDDVPKPVADPRAALMAMLNKRGSPPASSEPTPAAAAPKAAEAGDAVDAPKPAADPRAALMAMLSKRGGEPSQSVSSESAPAAAAAEPEASIGGPSEPAAPAGAPRANMLSEMLSKRSGAGAGATKPAESVAPSQRPAGKAGAPAPAAKPAHPNPCSLDDRRHFVTVVTDFAAAAKARVADLETDVAAAEASAVALARFFGEEPKTTPPSRVFDALKKFTGDFNKSAAAMRARREKEAKAVATAALKEAAAGTPATKGAPQPSAV